MNCLFHRQSFDSGRMEAKRIFLGLAFVGVTSTVWHVGLPHLVYLLARSSVGCPARGPLIAEALRNEGVSLPDNEYLFNWTYPYRLRNLRTHSLPGPGWVAFSRRHWGQDDEFPDAKDLVFCDAQLKPQGFIRSDDLYVSDCPWHELRCPPGDYDADGFLEVLVCYPCCAHAEGDVLCYAVLRLHDECNEVVWCGGVDWDVWPGKEQLWPVLRRNERTGLADLAFVDLKVIRHADGSHNVAPPNIVALFEWDAPGGSLRPVLLPDRGGIFYWDTSADERRYVPSNRAIGPSD
jgi:hypothetical protein